MANNPTDTAPLAAGDLIDEREAAAILGVRVQTLRNWRWSGKPPRYRKLGRCVRYHRADLTAFVDGEQATA